MSAADHDDAITQFAMITAYEDTTHISNFLKLQNWDLEMAMNIFFSQGMPASCKTSTAAPSTAAFAHTPVVARPLERVVPSVCKTELTIGGCTIQVRDGNLATEDVDCVVNPANNRLKHDAGLAKELIRRGGDMIQVLSDIHISQSGPLEEGQVVATSPGELKSCQQILHAVGPMYQGGQEGEELILAMTVTNVLNKTLELGCTSVAIPAISSGIFGYPKARCCQVIFQTVVQYLDNGQSALKTIKLMANDAETVKCFENALNEKVAEDKRRELRKRRLEARKRRTGSFRVLCLGDNHTLGFHGVDKHTMYGLGNASTGDESTAKYAPYSTRLAQLISKQLEKDKMQCEFVTIASNGAKAAQALATVADLETQEGVVGESKAPPGGRNPAFSVVIVWLGTNDVLNGIPAANVFANIKAVHERLCSPEGLNCCVSAVCLLPPFDLSEWVPRWGAAQVNAVGSKFICENRDKVNALLRDFARETKRPLVGFDTAIFQDATQSVMWDDAIHYTPMGYRKLGEVIFHVLDAAEIFDL
jgi:O-acetyl-ADP-ribose deacetylase (regulator of RNase III)